MVISSSLILGFSEGLFSLNIFNGDSGVARGGFQVWIMILVQTTIAKARLADTENSKFVCAPRKQLKECTEIQITHELHCTEENKWVHKGSPHETTSKCWTDITYAVTYYLLKGIIPIKTVEKVLSGF